MNPTSYSHRSQTNRRQALRRGISLFEVLISILVASIGVMGALVLIPFAVKNAQRGIDREAAMDIARNFMADMEAYGYTDPDNWIYDGAGVVLDEPFWIDPITVANNVDGGLLYGSFPLDVGTATSTPPIINRISFRKTSDATAPLDLMLANRLMVPQDLLMFNEATGNTIPPIQQGLRLGGTDNAKRSYQGRYSVSAFVVPMNEQGTEYRMHTLVSKVDERDEQRVFVLDRTGTTKSGTPRNFADILFGGGDVHLTEYTTPRVPPIVDTNIRNGDWIMLINDRDLITDSFDDLQIAFYQVIHASETDPPSSPREYDVTLQGPDFDMFPDWEDTATGVGTSGGTFAILLPNVLTVNEQIIRTEPTSGWNSP